MKKDIRKISRDELSKYFIENNEKPFRVKQVWEWLWKKSASSFDEMSNLSKSLRDKLKEDFEIRVIR